MSLLLDIGNTRFKWARLEDGRVQPGGAMAHGGAPAAAFYGLALPRADAVWVACVLDSSVQAELARVIGEHFGFAPQFARVERQREGLTVAYGDPSRLGVDRWLCMLALWHELGRGFCVASAGTALTFDAVDDGGEHLGGLIGPGLLTAQRAVLSSTSFEASVQSAFTPGLGRDTSACVRQGALHACAGMIQRAAQLGHGAQMLTGGDAPALLPHLGGGWDWRPDLVLEGLALLAQENRR
ncbi:MAG TPA: type III pantothenate kinase [Candidatus Binatia bacterium]|nr:type III pantothenate kinase [Candidatus Binatia bacterium]